MTEKARRMRSADAPVVMNTEDVCVFLDISELELGQLRSLGMPFVPLTPRHRRYLPGGIVEWLRANAAKLDALHRAPRADYRHRRPARRSARRSIPLGVRFSVLERCNFACQYCGRRAPEVALHVDHVMPVALGGTGDESNLTAACEDCNLGKSGRRLGGEA